MNLPIEKDNLKELQASTQEVNLHLVSAPQDVVVCHGCNMQVNTNQLPPKTNAHCPRCETLLYRSQANSLTRNLILSITCLILFIPPLLYPFVTVRLLNVNFSASLLSGSQMLVDDGFVLLGSVILFCTVLTPILVFGGIIGAHIGLKIRNFRLFHHSMFIHTIFKHWLMIDVFLISILISFIKLKEYAQITPEFGLLFLLVYQIFAVTAILRISVRRYWELWQPARSFGFSYQKNKQQPIDNKENISEIVSHCPHCHLSQPKSEYCQRCTGKIHTNKEKSVQKTWLLLISAAFFLPPANYLNISQVFSNGVSYEDTIMSGVIAFFQSGAPAIGLIIFTASIAIPIFKVVSLFYILICIRFKVKKHHLFRMKLFAAVEWVGKWSFLDLFVITIMVNLLNRDQLLDFAPGPAAIAFGFAVILTMLAAECLDTRLIWKNITKNHQPLDIESSS